MAKQNLNRQGIECFYPRFRKMRRHARRVDHVLAPLFPGYIFVSLRSDQESWHAINGTFGIGRLIGPSTGRPQPMPIDVMEALLDRSENGIMKTIMPSLKPGQQAKIICGPFTDQLVTIIRLDDRDRVRVLLDILGGMAPASVPLSDLAPI